MVLDASAFRINRQTLDIKNLLNRMEAGTMLVPSEPSAVLGYRTIESLLIRLPSENLWFTSDHDEDQKLVWDPANTYTHNFIGAISLFLLEDHPLDNFVYSPQLNGTKLSENRAFQRRVEQTEVTAYVLFLPNLDIDIAEDIIRRIPR